MYYIQNKGYFDDSGRKVGSKRQIDLHLARVYGHDNDSSRFTRLIIESKVSRQLLNEAWEKGVAQRKPVAA